eukprot:CAMPEP_0116903216 /NCGR_PEP_ID=MMETSP0467-20121206/10592_1 /TAXON_ID=283647 /ORGANISM="Mesodinium pulex, Strain SPMC105" /LENGTH=66 /DNA_ID=CAMNT_0004577429 /DNA_START=562 /DNA_END=762 /DNA_ORIENTATION=-
MKETITILNNKINDLQEEINLEKSNNEFHVSEALKFKNLYENLKNQYDTMLSMNKNDKTDKNKELN